MEILLRGIDVSSHQGIIDWKKVKDSGVNFAFLRIGFRGYGKTGNLVTDTQFKSNLKGCIDNNIYMGAYFYATDRNVGEVNATCDFIEEVLKDNNATYSLFALPIVYDFEGYNQKNYRTYGISKEQRTLNCAKFNERMKAIGFKTMLYGSQGNIRTTYDLDKLKDWIWCAKYPYVNKAVDDEKYFPKIGKYTERVAIWQYSSKGRVNGINGNVDVDNMYIDILNSNGNPYKVPSTMPQFRDGLFLGNNDVRWLQWEMRNLGYYKDVIDGKYGNNTLNAVWSYFKDCVL